MRIFEYRVYLQIKICFKTALKDIEWELNLIVNW
jgi:hypothetical protein